MDNLNASNFEKLRMDRRYNLTKKFKENNNFMVIFL